MLEVATPKGAFIEFAAVAERVDAANTETAKGSLLREYLLSLQEDQLLHAVRYFTGHLFGHRDRSSVPVGEKTLISALVAISGVEPAVLTFKRSKVGDLAIVGADLLTRSQPILTLDDVAIAIEQIGQAKGSKRLNWVIKLLERATSLEAKYLIHLLRGNLQINVDQETLEWVVAQISGQSIQQIQQVYTMLGDLGQTAVLARNDQLDRARMQMFQPIKFMLASSVTDPVQLLQSLTQGYAIETKYNGIRAQAHIASADRTNHEASQTTVAGLRVALFSRTLQDITANFPDLLMPLAALTPQAVVRGESAGLILDGEIVPSRNGKILPLSVLQQRLGQPPPESMAELIAKVPVVFVAYDILYKDGTILINQPYVQRRTLLESLPIAATCVQLAKAQQFFDITAIIQQFHQARSQGDEGIMIKTLQSVYRSGRRSGDWFKVKQPIATLDVVVTAAEVDPEIHPSLFTRFAIAVRTSELDGTLLNLGKIVAHPALSDLASLSDWVFQHTVEEFASGRVRLIEPQMVLEVVFEAIQSIADQPSCYRLVSPSIVRVRHDKPPSEIDTIESVKHFAALQNENE